MLIFLLDLVNISRMINLPIVDVKTPEFFRCFSVAIFQDCPENYAEAMASPEKDKCILATYSQRKGIDYNETIAHVAKF